MKRIYNCYGLLYRSPRLPGQPKQPQLPGEPNFRPAGLRNNLIRNKIFPFLVTWRCGFQSSHRVSYFTSTPGEVAPPASCGYRVNLLPKVCQVRLDFIDLQTKPMSHGLCDPNNQLKISVGPGQVARVPVSQLCGSVAREGERPTLSTDLPHIYIHFEEQPGQKEGWTQPAYLQLEMKSAGLPSSWNIRVSQVTCDAPRLQAPLGCDQWYTSLTGTISSFAFSDRQYQVIAI